MNTTSFRQIEDFLLKYRQSIVKKRIGKTETLTYDFNRLLSEYEQFRSKAIDEAPFKAPSFNIFRLLGVTRDEVRTHSSFLAELLNPAGTHGQGDIFLRNFMEYCKSELDYFPIELSKLEQEPWNAFTEESVQEGRLDIQIINRNLGVLCVIENKIDAPEQDRQLERYQKYMKKRLRDFPTQALIFLSIRGKRSISASDQDYYRLSYHNDIFTWLQNTLLEIKAPIVEATIRQYMDVVRSL